MNLLFDNKKKQSIFLPLFIPIIFTIAISFTSFFIHQADEGDIIFYYNAGHEILYGDSSNVFIPNAGIGWPTTLAFFTEYVNDVYVVSKSIAIIASGLTIFITFFIIKNISNNLKIAFITQVFLAINPFVHEDSIILNNEMLPLFFIFLSIYFLTKNNFTKKYVLVGLFLGISFLFRYQAIFIQK